MAPLLTFKRTFDTTIQLGDITVPIHVRRLQHGELEALVEAWDRLVVTPRGSTTLSATPTEEERRAEQQRVDEWTRATQKDRDALFHESVSANITLDEGLIDDGGPVTTGDGLVKIFHGRRDVLRDLTMLVITENRLTELLRKNSPSPRAFAPSSEASSPSRGGDAPGSTATNAGSCGTAGTGDATAETTDTPSSGETRQIH